MFFPPKPPHSTSIWISILTLLKVNFENFFCCFTKLQLPILLTCTPWGFCEPALGKGVHKIILCAWGGSFQEEKVTQSFQCSPKFPFQHPPTHANRHTNIPMQIYVTCFPRRHCEHGQVTFRIYHSPEPCGPQPLCECCEAFLCMCEMTDLSC